MQNIEEETLSKVTLSDNNLHFPSVPQAIIENVEKMDFAVAAHIYTL